MDVVGAFVGIDDFQIDQVAGDPEFVGDAVAAEHVAGLAGNVEGLAAGVALDDRGQLDRRIAFFLQPAQAQAGLQSEADLGQHVRQLLLDQLVGGQGAPELLAVEHVLARGAIAGFGGAEGAPGDAEAGRVEAGEGAFQSANARHQLFFRHEDLVHHDLAGDRCAQADLAVDRRRAEALGSFLEDEPANLVVVGLGPDDEDVGNRRIGDPHLAAAEPIAAVHRAGAGGHRAGIGAVVRFRQPEAADPFAGRQLGQVFLLLRFGAELVDRHHHQRGLDAHHRPVAGVHRLDLARDQAVADVVEAGAAILLRDGRTEQAEFAHLVEDASIGVLVAKCVLDPRLKALGGVGEGGLPHHPFLFAQLLRQIEGVVPIEYAGIGVCHVFLLVRARSCDECRIGADLRRLGTAAQSMNSN